MNPISTSEIRIDSTSSGFAMLPKEVRWYALYTCSNHEKRVTMELVRRDIEHFLPLYKSARNWRDRTVRLELPLFPGYVFVRLNLLDRFRALQAPGVVRLVGFGSSPVPLPDSEIEILRSAISLEDNAHPHPFVGEGRQVRIVRGPFAGLKGTVRRKKNNVNVILSLSLIRRSIAVEVNATDLRPVVD